MSSSESPEPPVIRQLRTALHDSISITVTDGTIIEGPGGTRLVNGKKHDVEQWVGRRSKWGNPFKAVEHGGKYRREEAVDLYKGWFLGHVERGDWNVEQLRGTVLGCYCLPKLCHGIIILNHLAEAYDPQQTLIDSC